MNPNDTALIASLIALTAGLVTVFRKEWPKLDGRIVYALVLLVALGVTYLALDPSLGHRAIVFCGVKVAVGALALVTGVNAAIDRHSSGIGAAIAAALPIAQPLVGEVLSVEGPDGTKAEATKVSVKAPSIPPVVTALGLLGALLMAYLLAGCSSAAASKLVLDASGVACEVVVQEEKLPDLCSSLVEIEAAAEEYAKAKSATPGASAASDAPLYQKVIAYRAHHP